MASLCPTDRCIAKHWWSYRLHRRALFWMMPTLPPARSVFFQFTVIFVHFLLVHCSNLFLFFIIFIFSCFVRSPISVAMRVLQVRETLCGSNTLRDPGTSRTTMSNLMALFIAYGFGRLLYFGFHHFGFHVDCFSFVDAAMSTHLPIRKNTMPRLRPFVGKILHTSTAP